MICRWNFPYIYSWRLSEKCRWTLKRNRFDLIIMKPKDLKVYGVHKYRKDKLKLLLRVSANPKRRTTFLYCLDAFFKCPFSTEVVEWCKARDGSTEDRSSDPKACTWSYIVFAGALGFGYQKNRCLYLKVKWQILLDQWTYTHWTNETWQLTNIV